MDQENGKPDLLQSWNRYGYALGNPQRYVDPNGRWALPWEALDLYSYNESRKAFYSAWCEFVDRPGRATGANMAAKMVGNMLDTASLLAPGIPAVYGLSLKGNSQIHHIATHYGKAGLRFAEIFGRAGMDVKTSSANLMALLGHNGGHTAAYRSWTFERIRGATNGLSDTTCKTALEAELQRIRQILEVDPSLPYAKTPEELLARVKKAVEQLRGPR